MRLRGRGTRTPFPPRTRMQTVAQSLPERPPRKPPEEASIRPRWTPGCRINPTNGFSKDAAKAFTAWYRRLEPRDTSLYGRVKETDRTIDRGGPARGNARGGRAFRWSNKRARTNCDTVNSYKNNHCLAPMALAPKKKKLLVSPQKGPPKRLPISPQKGPPKRQPRGP